MSERPKQITRRFVEAFSAGDDTSLEEVLGADTVDHNSLPGQQPGRQGVIDALAMYRAAFPNLELMIENQVADGERGWT